MNADKVVNMVIRAYTEVLGVERWDSMSAEEQHDAIMIMVKDLDKTIGSIEGL